MNTRIFIFAIGFVALNAGNALAATCSRANLTRCLDSACALNISANPAARCQYCGTSDAGSPKTANLRGVFTGSTKYNISDKDLKSAPTDPGERYVWATRKCMEKLPDCTTDDVSETYDSLIEQSCKAAGINAKMDVLQAKLTKTQSSVSCENNISACVTGDQNCASDFARCLTDSDFARIFAECSVAATGCDQYTSGIKEKLMARRTNSFESKDASIDAIVATYQANRQNKLNTIRSGCADGSMYDSCFKSACENNTKTNCGTAQEKTIATALCKFFEIACGTIK